MKVSLFISIQIQICFLIKRKIENWQIYGQAYKLWYDNFGENQTPLQRNGMSAIPKEMQSFPFNKVLITNKMSTGRPIIFNLLNNNKS